MRLTAAQMDRALGVLLGQACGDTLGVPYEFGRPPGGDELPQMRGGGLGGYAPGEWSDDTQMAVAIAEVAATDADLTSADALDSIRRAVLAMAHSAGNGALMRTSVVALASLHDADQTAQAARSIAELTHVDPLAGDSCVLWSEVVRVAVLEGRIDVPAAPRSDTRGAARPMD
ncbi:MAG: ADP-ribosylglycohydrolase family protein [Nocardioidaceae bacterium]